MSGLRVYNIGRRIIEDSSYFVRDSIILINYSVLAEIIMKYCGSCLGCFCLAEEGRGTC